MRRTESLMPTFADHFSSTASAYASYRPHYPNELFSLLASVAPSRARVWNCATGSGQAVHGLLGQFDQVLASDPSTAQRSQRTRDARVSYLAMTAEQVALADASVDLVTVAQALHWFNRDRHYAETKRVLWRERGTRGLELCARQLR